MNEAKVGAGLVQVTDPGLLKDQLFPLLLLHLQQGLIWNLKLQSTPKFVQSLSYQARLHEPSSKKGLPDLLRDLAEIGCLDRSVAATGKETIEVLFTPIFQAKVVEPKPRVLQQLALYHRDVLMQKCVA